MLVHAFVSLCVDRHSLVEFHLKELVSQITLFYPLCPSVNLPLTHSLFFSFPLLKHDCKEEVSQFMILIKDIRVIKAGTFIFMSDTICNRPILPILHTNFLHIISTEIVGYGE
jgi:hypothetical protein